MNISDLPPERIAAHVKARAHLMEAVRTCGVEDMETVAVLISVMGEAISALERREQVVAMATIESALPMAVEICRMMNDLKPKNTH